MVNRHSRRRLSDARSAFDEPAEQVSPGAAGGSSFPAGHPSGLPVVAGYRVLRTLSSGERADIILGHAPQGTTDQAVAIKMFRHGADPASVEREIAALGGCPSGCLPRLIDVGTLADGRVVMVMERLGGGTVGSFLVRRSNLLHPGEAVTLIAPVVVALAAVHAMGFAHSTLSPGTVTLDENGRPVLTGLGGLRDLAPFGPRGIGPGETTNSRLDQIRADYARLTVFMRAAFDQLDRTTTAARQSDFLAAWFEGATAAVPFHPCLDELERRVFEWAPGVPLTRERDRLDARDVPGRVVPQGIENRAEAGLQGDPMPDADSSSMRPSAPARRLAEWLAILHLPDDIASTAVRDLDVSPLASVMKRARKRMMDKRLALIVAGCVATATTVMALTLLQPAGSPGDQGIPGSRPPTAGPQPASEAPFDAPDATARAAIAGDDPVAAVPHLLAARSACVAAARQDCLAGSDQVGSPIMAADLYRAQNLEGGAPLREHTDYAGRTAVLIERTGNSALLTLEPGADAAYNEPASLLVIKGEAGWRLREIFEAVDASFSPN